MTTNPSSRAHFDGVLQIARYNWPQYVCGLIVVVAAVIWLAISSDRHTWLWFTILAAALLTAWWCAASLVVSHWIYDRSALYRWSWISDVLPAAPGRWLNLHAGLDESSTTLHKLFPNSIGGACDFYAAAEMSAQSIRRARDQQNLEQVERVDYSRLPFADGAFDAVFLLFAAHELRCSRSREVFFRELLRVLNPSGTILLVEHGRDAANFAAFGPGFLHFLPCSEWRRLARIVGLNVAKERRMTPFVKVMLLRRRS